ncbi:Probable myosin light chain kinase DDB_G0284661 [Durusdinium trenchii]|uniref:Probable myosin light chain kinase DDB_G0284661 n=1 Tax=Durusdinium trenchii TaxID=1381693 RepID=A0ABP0LPR6_9DINO
MECVIEVDRVGAVHLGALLGHGGQAKVMECSLETPSVATVGKFYQELSWKGELNQTASHEFEMLQAAASPYVVKAYALQQVPHTAVLEKMVGGFRQVAKEAKTRTMEDRRVRTRDTDHTDLAADLMCPLQVSVLFMELCDISLQQIISQKFREAEAAFVCCSVLKALNHLHRHRILHRDVKPANILLADAGTRVVLSDFGLAAYLPTSSDTLRGPFCGTRGYTAPECSEADSLFSHEADVFALGVVLYFLLFRTYPFRSWDQCLLLGESPWSFVLEPCGRAVGRSESSCRLIRHCLALDRPHRPSAAQALESAWFQEVEPIFKLEKQMKLVDASDDELFPTAKGNNLTHGDRRRTTKTQVLSMLAPLTRLIPRFIFRRKKIHPEFSDFRPMLPNRTS